MPRGDKIILHGLKNCCRTWRVLDGDGGMEKELHGCSALQLNIVELFLSTQKC